MSTLQHWFALTFARLLHALAWQSWAIALIVVAVLVGIGTFLYRCYVKALEASD